MPSTYTESLRLEEQGVGENNNTWGEKLNSTIDLIDKAIAGHVAVGVVSGTVTLTSVNNAEDQSRYKIVELTGTLTGNVIVQVPAVSKEYVIWDSTTRDGSTITLRLGAAGNTLVLPAVTSRGISVTTDGTDWRFTVPEASVTIPGLVELATDTEAQTGTDTTRAITAANLQAVTATEARKGVIELATAAEAQTGTDTTRALTPATLQAVTATEVRKGIVELATAAEAQTGADPTRVLTPATLQTVTATTSRRGVIELATQSEVNAGTDTTRAVVPSTLKGYVDTRIGSSAAFGTAAFKNEGPGSGLNADTLDGLQAAEFARSNITLTAGAGLTGGGTLNGNRTFAHADTSSQASVNNSGLTFIQDVTLDGYGHVTGLTSSTATAGDVLGGITKGAIGAYTLAYLTTGTVVSSGGTVAGSRLRWSNADGTSSGTSVATGTWRLVSAQGAIAVDGSVNLFLRIS